MLDQSLSASLDPDAKRDEARALAAQGRFRDAIGLGQKLTRHAPDRAFAAELVGWRHRAYYAEPPPQRPRPDWPPNLPDPHRNLVDQIPEISPADLSGDVLGGALQHHGSLIVRGLLSASQTAALGADVDRAFAARDRNAGADLSWFSALAAVNKDALDGVRAFSDATSMLSVDTPHFLTQWINVVEGSGVLAAVEAYLGERPILSAAKVRLYRVPHNPGSQWHQDGAFLGGKSVRTVNLWVALTDCGEDAPGLEVIPWRIDDVLPTGTHGSLFDWSVGEGMIPELALGRATASPKFKAGDAMLFDHLCLHRTGVRPDMTRGRYALETWMFAPSVYKDDTPLLL